MCRVHGLWHVPTLSSVKILTTAVMAHKIQPRAISAGLRPLLFTGTIVAVSSNLYQLYSSSNPSPRPPSLPCRPHFGPQSTRSECVQINVFQGTYGFYSLNARVQAVYAGCQVTDRNASSRLVAAVLAPSSSRQDVDALDKAAEHRFLLHQRNGPYIIQVCPLSAQSIASGCCRIRADPLLTAHICLRKKKDDGPVSKW